MDSKTYNLKTKDRRNPCCTEPLFFYSTCTLIKVWEKALCESLSSHHKAQKGKEMIHLREVSMLPQLISYCHKPAL